MAKENKDFEFRKPFAICKEFREKVDKCVNHLTSSLKKHTFYNLLINNILYLCVT